MAHFQRSIRHHCSRKCQNTRHGKAGTPQHRMWEQAKRRAKKKGFEFSLSVHEIPPIPATCPVLGVRLQPNSVAGPLDTSPSLDRIEPSKGYVAGNVRIISHRANRIRSDASAEELRLIADDAARLGGLRDA